MKFTKLGLHWVALQCGDVNNPAWIKAKFTEFQTWGVRYIKLISSPGGDGGYPVSPMGCSEAALAAALEVGLKPVLRIFRGKGATRYWDGDVEANLRRLKTICAGYVLPVEPANEIDVEFDGLMHYEDALVTGRATMEFAQRCFDLGGILPLFPSVGYGGVGINFFEAMHEVGGGDLLDKMGVAIHPYRGPYPLNWGTDYELKLMTKEEYDGYHPWCWATGQPDYVSFEMVNRARDIEVENRKKYVTIEQKMLQYNYGWFTIDWADYGLQKLGHKTKGKFWLTEIGVEVGAKDAGVEVEPGVKFSIFPRVDPLHQALMVVEQEEAATLDERIAMTAEWLPGNQLYSGNTPNWESQAWQSAWWDKSVVPWPEQIKTNRQLPIVDRLIEIHREESTMSKLGFHIQEMSLAVAEAISAVQPTTVKIMGNALNPGVIQDIRQRSPNSLIIGRFWKEQQPYNDSMTQAISLVNEIESTGCGLLVDIWESYNEVANNLLNPTQVDLLDQFFFYFQQVIRSRWQKKTVIICSPCGNLGWPGEPSPLDFKRSLADPDTLVSFHGYEWHISPADDRVAYLFRPFTLMAQVLAKYPTKKFIFTEMGCTRMAVPGYPHDWGWYYNSSDLNGPYSQNEYKQVLRDIVTEANKHPNLIGVNIFETGAAGDWAARGFESVSEVKEVGMEAVLPPVYEVPIRVLVDGLVETMELEEYLRGVVPAESYASWHMEELKAQSVAARSYALACIAKHRPDYDVADDVQFQVYNPTMIHPRSDQAIKDTQGLYLVKNGGPQFTEYKAKCGRRTDCLYCSKIMPPLAKVYQGQMCQNGAQLMAEQGSDYRTILKHYYGTITFSDEVAPPQGDTMDSIIVCDLTDAKKYGVTIRPAQVTPGQGYWQVQSFKNLTANDGRHNFYADVLKDGLRVYGTQIKATWPPGGPGPAYFNIEKPLNEPGGNMAINKHDFLTFTIQGAAPSEQIGNVNTQFNGDPATGSSLYHWSFEGVWVWAIAGGTEPIPPTPGVDPFTTEDWSQLNTAQQALTVAQQNITKILTRHLH